MDKPDVKILRRFPYPYGAKVATTWQEFSTAKNYLSMDVS